MFTCTHQVHVHVQLPECLTCACKCAVSEALGSLHIFMHTSDTGLTAQLHKHVGQSDQCTFTNVQLHACLMYACKCAVSQTFHILMHTSVTGLTVQLHEHIGQSDQSTFTCTHQVHVNVQ